MKRKNVPIQESFRVAALLALTGGFLDAYTYLLRGGVFANAQTGNIVLLAVNLANRQWGEAGYYVIPIFAFSCGVFVTNLLKRIAADKKRFSFEQFVLGVEILLLFAAGFLPLSVPNGIVNVTVSFVCSVQVNTFRKVCGMPYASIMCTGNLRSGTEKLFFFIMEKDREAFKSTLDYFGVIFLFAAGAVAGTCFSKLLGVKSIWICCLLLFGVLWYIAGRPRE